MNITLRRATDLTADERTALRALSDAVYPPEVAAAWPGRALEWAPPEWGVIGWSEDGCARCHAGIVVREARWNDRPVRVGGIGGVKTHPAVRGRGHATAVIRRAVEFLRNEADVVFALLVCEPALVSFYERLGWHLFRGAVLVAQHGETVPFTFNLPMTVPVCNTENPTGTLDLMGPPW